MTEIRAPKRLLGRKSHISIESVGLRIPALSATLTPTEVRLEP